MLDECRADGVRDMTVQAPVPPASGTMDVDEFMAFLETRPEGERWDPIEGGAVMMAPASYARQRITRNLCEVLNGVFAAAPRDLFAYFDAGVRSPGVRNFQPQPDVVVVPGVAGHDYYSECFQLAGEVLSPTNTRAEIELKLRHYREAPENLYVVVIEPREFLVDVYARRSEWRCVTPTRAQDPIEMPEFGLRCEVVELYRGTPLDPQRT
jgi:Uma2 family endonuclease